MALICSGVYLIQAESIYLRFRLNPGPWGKEYVQINMVWRWQLTLGGGKLERRQVVSDCFMVWMVCSIMHCTLLLCGHCRINMCKYDLSWNQTEEKHCFDKQQASPEKKAQVQKASSVSENTKDDITSTLLLSLTRERTLKTRVKTNCSFPFCCV